MAFKDPTFFTHGRVTTTISQFALTAQKTYKPNRPPVKIGGFRLVQEGCVDLLTTQITHQNEIREKSADILNQ